MSYTFDIFAARDGDTYRGTVEAEDDDAARDLARPILAEHFRIDFDPDDPDYFDAELDGFTVEERGTLLIDDATIALYRKLADRLSDMVESGRLNFSNAPSDYSFVADTLAAIAGADPTGQPPAESSKPLPIDLIVASRDVVAAYGGDVPDWLRNEIGMLELALKPFAEHALPVPVEPAAEGDETPIRRLEQREGAELHTLVSGFYGVMDEALGLSQIDEGDEIAANMLRKHVGEWDDLAALVSVKRDDRIVELWVSDRYPDSDGVPFTCAWVFGELAA